MSSPSFNLIVRPEYYAQLTLESLIAELITAGSTDNVFQPPLPQP